MALFEEFGKKITGAGQGMAKQTKDFMEVSRLNALISDQEKQIQQLFTSIGEAYFRRHHQDPDAEEKASIDQIKLLYNEINHNRKNIDLIRGIIKCPRCGADVQVGSVFCSSCGMRMPQPVPQPQPQMAPQPQVAPQPQPQMAAQAQPQVAPQPQAMPEPRPIAQPQSVPQGSVQETLADVRPAVNEDFSAEETSSTFDALSEDI